MSAQVDRVGGISCRIQVADLADLSAPHLAQFLAQHLEPDSAEPSGIGSATVGTAGA